MPIVEVKNGDRSLRVQFPDDMSEERIQAVLRRDGKNLFKGFAKDKLNRVLRGMGSEVGKAAQGAARAADMFAKGMRSGGMQYGMGFSNLAAPEIPGADGFSKNREEKSDESLQDNFLFKLGQKQQQNTEEVFQPNPLRDQDFSSKLAEGVSSVPIPLVGTALFGPVAGATMYGSSAGESAVQEQQASGNLEGIDKTFLLNAGLGALTESVLGVPTQIARAVRAARSSGVPPTVFGKQLKDKFAEHIKKNPKLAEQTARVGAQLAKMGPKAKVAARIAGSAAKEGTQEALETLGSNYTASDIVEWDPTRPITEGVRDAIVIGAIIGGGLSATFEGSEAIERRRKKLAPETDKALNDKQQTLPPNDEGGSTTVDGQEGSRIPGTSDVRFTEEDGEVDEEFTEEDARKILDGDSSDPKVAVEGFSGDFPPPVLPGSEGEVQAEAKVETGAQLNEGDYPVVEVPLKDIKLSEDVPNFKSGANEEGVIEGEQLQGKFDRLPKNPITLWERKDGSLEVITGRHRLELANRVGEKTIPSQIVREADGFTKEQALVFDAETNIKDEKGTVKDYAFYFRNTSEDYTEEDANARGLLQRAKGRFGWNIGRNASDDVFDLFTNGKINDRQAEAIASTAPNNPAAQAVGAKLALQGKSADLIRATMQVTMVESGGNTETMDLFGHDDSALKTAEQQAKVAVSEQKQLRDQVNAVRGAAKRPEAAKKLGVDVKDPEAVRAKIRELEGELARWQNWPMHPDLVAKTKGDQGSIFELQGQTPQEIDQEKADEEAKQERQRQQDEIEDRSTAPLTGDSSNVNQGQLLSEDEDLFSGTSAQSQATADQPTSTGREVSEETVSPSETEPKTGNTSESGQRGTTRRKETYDGIVIEYINPDVPSAPTNTAYKPGKGLEQKEYGGLVTAMSVVRRLISTGKAKPGELVIGVYEGYRDKYGAKGAEQDGKALIFYGSSLEFDREGSKSETQPKKAAPKKAAASRSPNINLDDKAPRVLEDPEDPSTLKPSLTTKGRAATENISVEEARIAEIEDQDRKDTESGVFSNRRGLADFKRRVLLGEPVNPKDLEVALRRAPNLFDAVDQFDIRDQKAGDHGLPSKRGRWTSDTSKPGEKDYRRKIGDYTIRGNYITKTRKNPPKVTDQIYSLWDGDTLIADRLSVEQAENILSVVEATKRGEMVSLDLAKERAAKAKKIGERFVAKRAEERKAQPKSRETESTQSEDPDDKFAQMLQWGEAPPNRRMVVGRGNKGSVTVVFREEGAKELYSYIGKLTKKSAGKLGDWDSNQAQEYIEARFPDIDFSDIDNTVAQVSLRLEARIKEEVKDLEEGEIYVAPTVAELLATPQVEEASTETDKSIQVTDDMSTEERLQAVNDLAAQIRAEVEQTKKDLGDSLHDGFMTLGISPHWSAKRRLDAYKHLLRLAGHYARLGVTSAEQFALKLKVRLTPLIEKVWEDFQNKVNPDEILTLSNQVEEEILEQVEDNRELIDSLAPEIPEQTEKKLSKAYEWIQDPEYSYRRQTEKGRIESMDLFLDAFEQTIEGFQLAKTKLFASVTGMSDAPSLDNGMAQVGMALLMNRAHKLETESKDPSLVARSRAFRKDLLTVMKGEASDMGQGLQAVQQVNKILGAGAYQLEYENLLKKQQQQKLGRLFPGINSDIIKAWLKLAGDKAIEEVTKTVRKPRKILEKVLEDSRAEVIDQTFRQLFRMSAVDQKNRKRAIFENIYKNPTLRNRLSVEEAVELTNLLDAAWRRTRLKIFRQEFVKQKGVPKNQNLRKNLLDSIPQMVQLINLGAFDNEAFYNVLAPKFNLPAYDSKIATEIYNRAQKAQAMPEGELRQTAYRDLFDFVKSKTRLTTWQILNSWWYASVLSGIGTQGRNALGSASALLEDYTQKVARDGSLDGFINLTRGMLNGFIQSATYDFGPAMSRNKTAGRRNIKPGASLDIEQFSTDDRAWVRLLGNGKYVSRFMFAVDSLFYQASAELEATHQAMSQGRDRDLNSRELADFISETLHTTPEDYQAAHAQAKAEFEAGLLEEDLQGKRAQEIMRQWRPDEILAGMDTEGLNNTFNSEMYGFLGEAGKALTSLRSNYPILTPIFPFVRVAVNLTNFLISRVPMVGLAHLALRYEEGQDGKMVHKGEGKKTALYKKEMTLAEYQNLRGKLVVANVVGLTLLAAVMKAFADDPEDPWFTVTGSMRNVSPEKRKQLNEAGIRPYSVKIGDTYWDYRQAPSALVFSMIGSLMDHSRYSPNPDNVPLSISQKLGTMFAAGWNGIIDQSFLSSLSDLLGRGRVIQSDKAPFPGLIAVSRTVQGLVPNIAKEVNRWTLDPDTEQADAWWEYFIRDTPVAKNVIDRPLLNILGEPIQSVRISKPWSWLFNGTTGDRRWQVLGKKAQQGAFLPAPSSDTSIDTGKEERRMTSEEFYDYYKAVGEGYSEWLTPREIEKIDRMDADKAKAYYATKTRRIRERVKRKMVFKIKRNSRNI